MNACENREQNTLALTSVDCKDEICDGTAAFGKGVALALSN